jgi:fido (protein-threonine AMPylation protein)
MQPSDCPAWEYTLVPNAKETIAKRCIHLLVSLRHGQINHVASSCDTRQIHFQMFEETTPAVAPYYAGHYRGEKFRCLEFCNVMVGGDPRVGVPHSRVASDMSNLADNIIRAGFSAVTQGHALPSSRVSEEDKLFYVVTFACRILVEFLRVHPYANGNGHMGRFIVWLILAKFGYWPKRWPLHQSPPYHDLLKTYRDGDPTQLEKFVLQCL